MFLISAPALPETTPWQDIRGTAARPRSQGIVGRTIRKYGICASCNTPQFRRKPSGLLHQNGTKFTPPQSVQTPSRVVNCARQSGQYATQVGSLGGGDSINR